MKSRLRKKYIILCGISMLVVIVTGVWLIRYILGVWNAEDTYDLLSESNSIVVDIDPGNIEPDISETDGNELPEYDLSELSEEMFRVIDFTNLKENTNSDIYAWIYIPGTNIDYPILQHPTDNSYYLNYNLDGSYGYPGCIYTEKENAKDFSDFQTVVYGHNMKDGSMFRTLHNFSDEEFFAENEYVYIYLDDRTLQYEIFAAYQYGDSHLLYAFDYSTEEGRNEYLSEVFSIRDMSANFRDDVEVTADSNVLTLSTCTGTDSDRYLVQAVLVQDIPFYVIVGE